MLARVTATRYVTPLREGGSLPGLVEADDRALYVLKFAGAGQGRKTLVAEVVCGELARLLGLRVPGLRGIGLDPVIGLGEPDEQVQSLLKNSGGLNLGMDYLSGALGFDPLAYGVEPAEAGRILWFDALVGNVDRSWRNPNLLVRDGQLWLIDHGASMIWQHNWPTAATAALRPYDASDHVLAPFGPDLAAAARELAPRVSEGLLAEAVGAVPDAWLADEPGFEGPEAVRRAYVSALLRRAEGLTDRIDLGPARPERRYTRSGWITPASRPGADPEEGTGEGADAGTGEGVGEGTGAGRGADAGQPVTAEPQVFEYAPLRLVPRVERGEYLNAGVLLYSRGSGFVAARTRLDEKRLTALDPDADLAGVRAVLHAVEAVCRGGDGAGPAAGDDAGRRFRWLVAPRSALLQPGPVHTGLTRAPQAELDQLLDRLVP